jgi:predicted RND superfamily exporter protein
LRVAVQVESTGVLTVLRYAEGIVEIAKECLPPEVHVETSGFYPLAGNVVREVLRGQAQGFCLCFFSVMVVITLGVRSVRLALLAALPNLFPLMLLGGILGLTFDVVDAEVLGIAIVSFGLAVDDTIHFLHRYDIETAKTPSRKTALERTFRYTGSAIVRTTVILGIGLLPFSLSGYASTRLLGTYLVFVLGCAVLGDLLLLPALVLLFGKTNNSASSGVS